MAGLQITPTGVNNIKSGIDDALENIGSIVKKDTEAIVNVLTNEWASPESKKLSIETGHSLSSMSDAALDATNQIVERINEVISQYERQESVSVGHVNLPFFKKEVSVLDKGTNDTLPDGESVGVSDNTTIEAVFNSLTNYYSDIAMGYTSFLGAIVGIIRSSGAFDAATIAFCASIADRYKESISAELENCKSSCKSRMDAESASRVAVRDSRNVA